jgi:hypothetical protein
MLPTVKHQKQRNKLYTATAVTLTSQTKHCSLPSQKSITSAAFTLVMCNTADTQPKLKASFAVISQ